MRVLVWGLIGGGLILVLKLIEYKHLVHAYPTELYGGLVAIIFTVVGVYLGRRWTRPREVVVVQERRRPESGPFEPDPEKLAELAITQREHQILDLIAEGLSNREIAERIFVTESTVKTHAYRLFEKLSVKRRVQAVQRGRELGLLP